MRRRLAAEFLGAFAIVFIGSGSIMMSMKSSSQAALLAGGFAYATTLAAFVAAFASISAHFNPAVTTAFVLTRRTRPLDGAAYIAVQLAGAVVGAWLLSKTFPPEVATATRLGGTQFALDVTLAQGIVLEAVTTALLVIAVLGVSATQPSPAALGGIVGAVVGALIMAIGPLTGASFNPARSFGPALISGIWEGHLAYWIGPIVGAIGGTLVWDFLLGPDKR